MVSFLWALYQAEDFVVLPIKSGHSTISTFNSQLHCLENLL